MTYSEFVSAVNSREFHIELVPTEILHAMIGVATECGEFCDPIKKAIYYGTPIDYVNLDEEVGDILWYLQLYANQRGRPLSSFMEQNMKKLIERYGSSWSQHNATFRNLVRERAALEGDGE